MSREEKFEQLVSIKGGVGVLAHNILDRDERIVKLEARKMFLETALRLCIARAGIPDPLEACRAVIRTAEDALNTSSIKGE